MSGLDYLRGHIEGRYQAPMARTLGFRLTEVEEGLAVFTVTPTADHLNPMDTVHAGMAMTLLDSAMGAAVHSTLPDGAAYTTLETKVNLVRALTPEVGEMRAEGRVVHRGRTTATCEGRFVAAADGKLYAHGTSTCLILAPRG